MVGVSFSIADVPADLMPTVRIAWSTQAPLPALTQAAKATRERLRFGGRRDASRSPSPIDEAEAIKPEAHHFPVALTKMFGYLPQVPHDKYLRQYVRPSEEQRLERSQRRDGKVSRGTVMPKEVHLFPSNLSFKKADWVNSEIGSDRRGYNVIFACVLSMLCETLADPIISAFPFRNGYTSTEATRASWNSSHEFSLLYCLQDASYSSLRLGTRIIRRRECPRS